VLEDDPPGHACDTQVVVPDISDTKPPARPEAQRHRCEQTGLATPDWQMMKIDIGDVLWKHDIVTRPAVIDGGDALREMGAGLGADFQVVLACVKSARQ
jgi:hypothetical protein